MALKLTREQLEAVRRIAVYSENFLEQVEKIAVNAGLDQIEGCCFWMAYNPSMNLTTKNITIGDGKPDFGYAKISKGRGEKKYAAYGKNSFEYEILFADEGLRERIQAAVDAGKSFPPDGLWISADDDCPAVDSRGNLT